MARSEPKSGEVVKPQPANPEKLIQKIYGIHVRHIRVLDGYHDANYHVIADREEWDNPNIAQICLHGYVFKVMNSFDSQSNHVEAETMLQEDLCSKGFDCPQLVLTVTGSAYNMELMRTATNMKSGPSEQDQERHLCRLLTYIPGETLASVHPVHSPDLLYDIGKYIAALHGAMEGVRHPSLDSYHTVWSLQNLQDLEKFITMAEIDETKQNLVRDILRAFQVEILPNLEHYSKGVIHGDINPSNLLVVHPERINHDQPRKDIFGIIDFGESLNSCYIFDLAVAIMHLMPRSTATGRLSSGGHVLAGYLATRTLNEAEVQALRVCVAGRYAQVLVFGEYNYALDPSNLDNEYTRYHGGCSWAQLEEFWSTEKDVTYGLWKRITEKRQNVK